jgi:hypothetical protein
MRRILLIPMLAALAGCHDVLVDSPDPAAILLTADTVRLAPDERGSLAFILKADDGSLLVPVGAAWTSRDPSVVSVDSTGGLRAHAAGTTRIVIAASGIHDSAAVVVRRDWTSLGGSPNSCRLRSDGEVPHQPPGGPVDIHKYWAMRDFQAYPGISQEFCRDLKHTSWGISAATQLAETARIQGVPLFSEQAKRITGSMEFAAKWQLANLAHKPIPADLCKGRLNLTMRPVLEVGYAAYKGRYPLPYTKKLLLRQRPAGVSLFQAWETLTSS